MAADDDGPSGDSTSVEKDAELALVERSENQKDEVIESSFAASAVGLPVRDSANEEDAADAEGGEEEGPAQQAGGQADGEGGHRLDLISRELLDELSHEHDEYGRYAPTPPMAGFNTPSETRTPSPRESPQPAYYEYNLPTKDSTIDGMVSADAWDWKTDAPEFVPGSLAGLTVGSPSKTMVAATYAGQQSWPSSPTAQTAQPNNALGNNPQLAQLRSQYEWQLRTKAQQLEHLRQRMSQLEIEMAKNRSTWDDERRTFARQIAQYRATLERYCIPLDELNHPSFSVEETAQPRTGVTPSDDFSPPSNSSNTLTSKMRQLNNLLQDGSTASQWGRSGAMQPDTETNCSSSTAQDATSSNTVAKDYQESKPLAQTLKQPSWSEITFPDEADNRSVEQQVHYLEQMTKGQVDERAMRSLWNLSTKDAKEALKRVEDLVRDQGWHCDNLSSILQSVCRKIEKYHSKAQKA